jgi:hypothetical protein
MTLGESDPSLAAVCRSVEARLQKVSCLAGAELPVVLLPHFKDLAHPVTPKDPVAYKRSDQTILVNAEVFPSLSSEAAQFALAHEIGHHAHRAGITGFLPECRGVHPCIIADWLATQWGFADEMRMERVADRGAEYCQKLYTLSTEAGFVPWAEKWDLRFRAGLVGRKTGR